MALTENVVVDRLRPGDGWLIVDTEWTRLRTARQIEPNPSTVARWTRRYLRGTPQQRLDFVLHYVVYWPKMVVKVMNAVNAAVAAERRRQLRRRHRRQPRARRNVAIPLPAGP